MVRRLHRVLRFSVKTVAFTLCEERSLYKVVNRQGSGFHMHFKKISLAALLSRKCRIIAGKPIRRLYSNSD